MSANLLHGELPIARLVVPAPRHTGRFRATTEPPPDGYAERLIKYIPAESVAFYLLADGIISSRFDISPIEAANAATEPQQAAQLWSWVVFSVALLGTPVYLRLHQSRRQPWRAHAAISTFAFACWAYAVGGSAFIASGLHDPLLGGLAVAFLTYVAGMFKLTVPPKGA